MPALWIAIQTFLFTAGPALVAKILTALGIGLVTYTGADFAVSEAETYILNNMAGWPTDVYQIMALAGLDQGIRMMFAAMSAYVTIRVTMGAFSMFKANPAVLRA